MCTSFFFFSFAYFTDAFFCYLPKPFFEAHSRFAPRFPNGILQFEQMVGQLLPDVLEDFIARRGY